MIATSFIVMLIPLAMFCMAQMSATLGKKVASAVTLFVAFLLIALGVLTASGVFLGSGVLAATSFPFFLMAIVLRERHKNPWAALVVLLLPILFTVFVACYGLPHGQTFFLDLEKSAGQMGLNQSADLALLKPFLSSSAADRLLWFAFGSGSFSVFTFLLVAFANLACLDIAYEQIDKLRAVVYYIIKNHGKFSLGFVKMFLSMPVALSHQVPTGTVKSHASVSDQESSNQVEFSWKAWLLKPVKPKNTMKVKNTIFFFEKDLVSWNLRNFTLPFSVILVAIVFMAGILFGLGDFDLLATQIQNDWVKQLLAVSGILSLAVLALLTLQGMFVVYTRVSTFFALAFFFCVFVLGTHFSVGPFVPVAIFGAVSILDNLYDWRGRKI